MRMFLYLVSAFVAASTALPDNAHAETINQPVTVTVDAGTTASAANASVTMTGEGSGANGPTTAQYGTNISCSKDSWQTTSSVGEIDCVNINLHQGGPGSDASGLLIGAQSTGKGFINDVEMVADTVDPSTGSTSYYVDLQLGEVTSNSEMYGAIINAVDGAGVAALYVNAEGSSSWSNVLQAASGGAIFFKIDGTGNITTNGSVTTASLTTSGAVRAESTVIEKVSQSQEIRRQDCGTVMRSSGKDPVILLVPLGLPLGCHISVIQAAKGSVTFRGAGTTAEHLDSPSGEDLTTQGQYAQAFLLVDSAKTFLLEGQIGSNSLQTVNSLSDQRSDFGNVRLVAIR